MYVIVSSKIELKDAANFELKAEIYLLSCEYSRK